MLNRHLAVGAVLAAAFLVAPFAASAQSLSAEQAQDLILDAVAIELAEDLCDNVDIPGEELVEIGEAKHFLRAKAGLTKVELAAARGAMEGEAKKNKAAYCDGARRSYKATYRKLLAATD